MSQRLCQRVQRQEGILGVSEACWQVLQDVSVASRRCARRCNYRKFPPPSLSTIASIVLVGVGDGSSSTATPWHCETR